MQNAIWSTASINSKAMCHSGVAIYAIAETTVCLKARIKHSAQLGDISRLCKLRTHPALCKFNKSNCCKLLTVKVPSAAFVFSP